MTKEEAIRIKKHTKALDATLGLMVATGEISKETKITLDIAVKGFYQIISSLQQLTPKPVEQPPTQREEEWISVEDRLPEIKEKHSRVELPLYVELPDGVITIADYTKSEFRDGQEWVGVFKPIWICRERGISMSDQQIHPTKWKPLPSSPKN